MRNKRSDDVSVTLSEHSGIGNSPKATFGIPARALGQSCEAFQKLLL
jgi:hypothetical protein